MALQPLFPSLLLTNGAEDRNMCSLNSTLQLMRHIPEFLEKLKEWDNVTPLLTSLNYILSKCGTNRVISASPLREHLAKSTGRPLNDGNQYDTVELLGYLLDKCPNDLFNFSTSSDFRFNINGHPSPCPVCQQVQRPVSESDRILKISLPQSSSTLGMLLEKHFSVRHQSDGRRCPSCMAQGIEGERMAYMERLKLIQPPEYLLVQLLRMDFAGGKTVKNAYPVEIPDEVKVDEAMFKVIGTITHMGTAQQGHNRAYLKEGSRWFLCEDSKVCVIKTPIDSASEQNYCILLKKCGNEGAKQQQPQVESKRMVG